MCVCVCERACVWGLCERALASTFLKVYLLVSSWLDGCHLMPSHAAFVSAAAREEKDELVLLRVCLQVFGFVIAKDIFSTSI